MISLPHLPPRARVFLAEALFFSPFWLVPVVAGMIKGIAPPKAEIAFSLVVSVALSVLAAHRVAGGMYAKLLVYAVLLPGSLIATNLTLLWQGAPHPEVMLAIIDTSTNEAREFLQSHAESVTLAAFLSAIVVLVPVGAIVAQRALGLRYVSSTRDVLCALAGMAVLLPLLVAVKFARNPDVTAGVGLRMAWESFPRNLWQFYPPVLPYPTLNRAFRIHHELSSLKTASLRDIGASMIEKPSGPRTYVILIGESLSQARMSLYSHHRKTTPRMEALRDNGELLVLQDVITPHVYTVPALLAALTQGGEGQQPRRTVMDVLGSAGFKTYWVSNQYKVGVFDSAIAKIAASAHKQIWLNPPVPLGVSYVNQYDHALLGPLQEILTDEYPHKVVFLHMAGSHILYQQRYPGWMEIQFSGDGRTCLTARQKELIAHYDRSVAYNDFVFENLITLVRDHGQEAFVLYFSDHGEEVFEFRDFHGHGNPFLSPYMARVPLVLWMSEEFKSRRGDVATRARAISKRPYSLEHLFHGILDLSGVSGADATRSVFSNQFTPRQRLTGGRDVDKFMHEWSPTEAFAHGRPLIPCGSD